MILFPFLPFLVFMCSHTSLTESVEKASVPAFPFLLNIPLSSSHLVLQSWYIVQFFPSFQSSYLFLVFLSNVFFLLQLPCYNTHKCGQEFWIFVYFPFYLCNFILNPFHSSPQANFSETQLLYHYLLAQNHQLHSCFSGSNPDYLRNLVISIILLIYHS